MRANEILNEKASRGRPVVCVDVQPGYTPHHSVYDNYISRVAKFLSQHRGPILMYVNADETGLTEDNIQSDIFPFWAEAFENIGIDFYESPTFDNIEWFDKGYGYMRSWMDSNIEDSVIIKTIRLLYQQKVNDTRDLKFPVFSERTAAMTEVMHAVREMDDDPLTVGWVAVDQLKRYNNCYLIGGGEEECLKELSLLMNAFNIKYTKIDSLIY